MGLLAATSKNLAKGHFHSGAKDKIKSHLSHFVDSRGSYMCYITSGNFFEKFDQNIAIWGIFHEYAVTVMTFYHASTTTCGNWFQTNQPEHESDDGTGDTVNFYVCHQ